MNAGHHDWGRDHGALMTNQFWQVMTVALCNNCDCVPPR